MVFPIAIIGVRIIILGLSRAFRACDCLAALIDDLPIASWAAAYIAGEDRLGLARHMAVFPFAPVVMCGHGLTPAASSAASIFLMVATASSLVMSLHPSASPISAHKRASFSASTSFA